MTNIFTILGEEEPEPLKTKICVNCKVEKPLEQFWINRSSKDGRCIPCHNSRKKDVKFLREHPDTPPMPSRCDCCGRTNPKKLNIPGKMGDNLCLDHTYRDDKPVFRGWICKQCNSGIGYLGDTPYDVLNAMIYLLRKSTNEDRWKLMLYYLKKLHEQDEEESLSEFRYLFSNLNEKEITEMIDGIEIVKRQ